MPVLRRKASYTSIKACRNVVLVDTLLLLKQLIPVFLPATGTIYPAIAVDALKQSIDLGIATVGCIDGEGDIRERFIGRHKPRTHDAGLDMHVQIQEAFRLNSHETTRYDVDGRVVSRPRYPCT